MKSAFLGVSSVSPARSKDSDNSSLKKGGGRTTFTPAQLARLEEIFQDHPHPEFDHLEEIAEEMELRYEVIRVWFKNRRAKQKKGGSALKKAGSLRSPNSSLSSTSSSHSAFEDSDSSVCSEDRSGSPSLPNFSTFVGVLAKKMDEEATCRRRSSRISVGRPSEQ